MRNKYIESSYIKSRSLNGSVLLFSIILFSMASKASNTSTIKFDNCILKKSLSMDQNMTLQVLNETCNEELLENKETFSAVEKRFKAEKKLADEPFAIIPHKKNYILPISYSNNINQAIYVSDNNRSNELKNTEAKLQISFKIPLMTNSLFTEGDSLSFGFTLQSWWQMYTQELSRPFRETNYQPEFFYFAPLDFEISGGKTGLFLGIEHQSNGQSQSRQLSRSWNRIYANFIFAKDNFALSFRPWWKIPEGDKVTTPEDPGNDNPDISDYMGSFELMTVYKWENIELSAMGRENFKEHKGAVEIGVTFPLIGNIRGYFQYFNGYGESLIDYNYSQERFGIGVALNDYF